MSCPCPPCNNDWGGECLYERIQELEVALEDACRQVEESTHHMAAIATRHGWQSGPDHTCVVTHNAAAWACWGRLKAALGNPVSPLNSPAHPGVPK